MSQMKDNKDIWVKLNKLAIEMKDIRERVETRCQNENISGLGKDSGYSSPRSPISLTGSPLGSPNTNGMRRPPRSPLTERSVRAKGGIATPVSEQSGIKTPTRISSHLRRESTPGRSTVSAPSSAPSKIPSARSRIGRLTTENVSSLDDGIYRKSGPRSVSSAATEMFTSSTSSRLYDPNYLKNREERLRQRKEQMEMRNCSFRPSVNRTTASPGTSRMSRSGSIESLDSAVRSPNVSSRLYNPNYIRARESKLKALKEERELLKCTFMPQINKSKRPAGSPKTSMSKAA